MISGCLLFIHIHPDICPFVLTIVRFYAMLIIKKTELPFSPSKLDNLKIKRLLI